MSDFDLDIVESEEPVEEVIDSAATKNGSWPFSCESTTAKSCK